MGTGKKSKGDSRFERVNYQGGRIFSCRPAEVRDIAFCANTRVFLQALLPMLLTMRYGWDETCIRCGASVLASTNDFFLTIFMENRDDWQ